MVKARNLLWAVAMGAFSALNFSVYYNTPVNTYETQLLRGTAGYAREYNGFGLHTPDKLLEYISQNLKITDGYAPSEKSTSLEKEIAILQKQITENTSREIYKPIFKNIADELDDMSIKYKRGEDAFPFLVGVLCAGAALLWFTSAFKEEKIFP